LFVTLEMSARNARREHGEPHGLVTEARDGMSRELEAPRPVDAGDENEESGDERQDAPGHAGQRLRDGPPIRSRDAS